MILTRTKHKPSAAAPDTRSLEAEDGLVVTGLSFRYTTARCVLQQLDLAIAPGRVHCVLGRSGCGKTTLLRLIAGLERVEQGSISIARTLVSGEACHVPPERRGVGIVFQDLALFPTMTVGRNVEFGMRGVPRRERRAACDALLERVGLTGFGGRMPHTLSGGQQQRVALARALAAKPRVLLLDEPFSGLDADLRATLRRELIDVLRAAGVATLMVTHDPAEARAVADTITVLGCDGQTCSAAAKLDAIALGLEGQPLEPRIVTTGRVPLTGAAR